MCNSIDSGATCIAVRVNVARNSRVQVTFLHFSEIVKKSLELSDLQVFSYSFLLVENTTITLSLYPFKSGKVDKSVIEHSAYILDIEV